MDQFFTWATLATFAGCATATAVITQFIKNLKGIKNVATQWISYGIALVLLFAATYFTGGLTGPEAALIPFNAILIALAANGAYAAITRVNQVSTANDADGDIPAGAASSGVTIEQTDETPTADAQTGTAQTTEFKTADEAHAAFPGLDNVTLEEVNTAVEAANIAIGKATDDKDKALLTSALAALKTLQAAKAAESGAVTPDTTSAK